ncbi:MAG: hypothetical protein HGA44_06815, partial [Cellulomonadaceae bacterium]|nr:hypothetical protein [Cellulomonadaceae bacterium]
MADDDPRVLDDEPVSMTMSERTVWAYLVTVVLTSGVYLALMIARLAQGPVAQITWVAPMLWTIGASVLGTVLFTIVGAVAGTITGAIGSVRRGRDGQPKALGDRK